MSKEDRKINNESNSRMKDRDLNIVESARLNKNDVVIDILKENPQAINDQDPKTGMTALHWVGANMNYELGEILFSQKNPPVDPFIQDNFDRYAFDLANDMGNERVIELFFQNIPDDPDNVADFDDGPTGMG